jgi:hypothetical protein
MALFDGTLGDWNLPPVSFEIKEGMKPYHGRAYPIPQIHKAVLMKEIDRLCSIGVLKWQPNSEWASSQKAKFDLQKNLDFFSVERTRTSKI